MKLRRMTFLLLLFPCLALAGCSTYMGRSGQNRIGVAIGVIMVGAAVGAMARDNSNRCSQP